MKKRRKPQRVPKPTPKPKASAFPAASVPQRLTQLQALTRSNEYASAWILSADLPPLPGTAPLRATLRLYAGEITAALDELTRLLPRMSLLRNILARLQRSDPAQLEASFGERYTYSPKMMVDALLSDPTATLAEETYSALLRLVRDERHWKETHSGQPTADDDHDWTLLREMLRSFPSPWNLQWAYSIQDKPRLIREIRDVTGAPSCGGLPAPVYAMMMDAALNAGDLETGEALLAQPDWEVTPALREYIHAVLLGRAALLRGDATLVSRALDVESPGRPMVRPRQTDARISN